MKCLANRWLDTKREARMRLWSGRSRVRIPSLTLVGKPDPVRVPSDTVILPGHGPATTVADELAANPFMRLFRGVDEPPPARACRVGGPFGLWEAELVLLAVDYDGGRKALVRFPTIGRSIVPGSQLYTTDGRPWPVDG
jgi:hypothetical protein